MSSQFVGNISEIFNCEELILQVSQQQGEIHKGHLSVDLSHPDYEKYLKHSKLTTEAGYNETNSVEFKHYKPVKHFDQRFVEIFSKFVKAEPLVVFVSEIKPGRMIPWHYDIDQFKEENSSKGKIVRFHLHLSKPQPGHIFILENQAFYNTPQGNVYQWNNPEAWHAGVNCGFTTKYLFTFKGYV